MRTTTVAIVLGPCLVAAWGTLPRPLGRSRSSIFSFSAAATTTTTQSNTRLSATAYSTASEPRIFLDTANVTEWEALIPRGIFYGITTNPTLLERAGVPCTIPHVQQLAVRALEMTDEFMAQVWADGCDENETDEKNIVDAMVQCGLALSMSIPDRQRIVLKCPVTAAGTCAARELQRRGLRICLTAGYSARQAFVAASFGAEYLAPYVGRMTDRGRDGLAEARTMHHCVQGMGAAGSDRDNRGTRILVASLRSIDEVVQLAAEDGLNTFTISPQLVRELWDEPWTTEAADEFEAAARRGAKLESEPRTKR